MNHFRSVGVAVLALSMGLGSLASAQERGQPDRNDRYSERRGPSDRIGRNQGPDHRDVRVGDRDPRGAYIDRRGPRVQPRHDRHSHWREHRGEWRSEVRTHEFRRGGRLPDQYRGRQYLVNDWRRHQLSQPPRGYHWVQAGGDYVLAAIATGVILQILLNN